MAAVLRRRNFSAYIMSRIYDNWERLVAAVLKKQQLWELCHRDSFDSSFSSLSSDFSYSFSRRFSFDLSGVPKLIRSEIEAACEDFSNIVIGSSSTCILYKGLLSSGVEIAVASVAMAAVNLWSDSLEAQFRNKIDTLSKVNHKNFLNLIGYCMEEEPFTRMMVFEYAPNGTLFEYLHLGTEAEQLDWATRLRIVMGIAYSVEHSHLLKPAFLHRSLTSSAVYLTEDYAAKLSDFFYWDEVATADKEPTVQSDVYSFGVILFEMITGRIPYSDNWLPEFPRVQSLVGLIDPTLETHCEDQLEQIRYVINSCANPDPRERPAMREVCAWLKKITGIRPDAPKPRPLLPGILRDMLKLKS